MFNSFNNEGNEGNEDSERKSEANIKKKIIALQPYKKMRLLKVGCKAETG